MSTCRGAWANPKTHWPKFLEMAMLVARDGAGKTKEHEPTFRIETNRRSRSLNTPMVAVQSWTGKANINA